MALHFLQVPAQLGAGSREQASDAEAHLWLSFHLPGKGSASGLGLLPSATWRASLGSQKPGIGHWTPAQFMEQKLLPLLQTSVWALESVANRSPNPVTMLCA